MKRFIHRAVIISAFLAASYLIISCGTRKKAKSRLVDQTEIKLEATNAVQIIDSSSQHITNQAGITKHALSRTMDYTIKPLDSSQPATVHDEPMANGGRMLTVSNGQVTVSERTSSGQTLDTSQTNAYFDSFWKKVLNQEFELDQDNDTNKMELAVESKKPNPFPWFAIAGAIIGVFGLWRAFKTFGS